MSVRHKEAPVSFADYLGEMRETASVLAWVWSELIGSEGKKWSLWMAVAMVGMTLLFALQPLIFSWMVNAVRDSKLQMLILAGALLASAALLHHGIAVVQELLREFAWNRNMHHLQTRVNQLFYEKSLGQHSEEGSMLNYASIDRAKGRVELVQQMLLFDTGSMIVGVLFSYALLWTLSLQVGALATVLIVVHVGWSLYLNYHVAKETDSIEQEFRAHSRQLIERWEKIARVKTSGKTASEHARLSQWFGKILGDDRRFWFWFIRQAGVRDTVVLVTRLLVIGYGAYLVYRGDWRIGTLVPLYAWMTEVSQNLWYIGHAERRLNQQVPYIRAMQKALSMPPAFSEEKGLPFPEENGVTVAFHKAGLRYGGEDGGYRILRDISFTILPGEKVALIGPSGAGKTSIMKLLLRSMDPTEGEVRVNGACLRDLRLPDWMGHLGYIPQQPQVLDGTIRYNLTFGLSEERAGSITDDEVWEVMRRLQIDFGERLTNGLETRVGRDGVKLSGGQAQRLMIGAAVIKRPRFMLIDEATSSLDSTTERLVQQGLRSVLTGSVGALIVAHRLSTVRTMCDRFLVLRPLEETHPEAPQIEAEAGSFEELYAVSPTFRSLADDQHLSL